MSQEQEIDLIINSTQEGIVAIDCDERITLFNRGAELIIGRKPQEVLGRPVQQVIQDSALPEVLRTG
ncbi:MAG: sigma-54-dependent Fis family transcriptional regulator, partial [Spirochaetales bacterium]